MRKWMLLLLLLVGFQWGSAQQHLPDQADYERFMKSKTMVVMDDVLMSEFNMVIREIMERSWSLTPFEVISFKEFDKLKSNPDLSFLMTSTVTFDKDRTKARYNFISLLMGEAGANIRTMPDLCSLPLSYLRVEEASYHYKLEAFILFFQRHVQNVLQNPKLIGDNGLKQYRGETSLAGKTLLLIKEDLARDVQTPEAIAAVYPYAFKIVSREEVAEAIKRQDPDAVFLHKVGPEGTRIRARVYKMLVGAADSKLYYWDYQMIKHASDDAFQAKDFKRLK